MEATISDLGDLEAVSNFLFAFPVNNLGNQTALSNFAHVSHVFVQMKMFSQGIGGQTVARFLFGCYYFICFQLIIFYSLSH